MSVPGASRTDVPKQACDRAAITREVKREYGLEELESELGHPTVKPSVPEPAPVDVEQLRRDSENKHLAGISWYRRKARAEAREAAAIEATTSAESIRRSRLKDSIDAKTRLDESWGVLERTREAVDTEAVQRVTREESRLAVEHAAAQKQADDAWLALLQNDRDTISEALTRALRQSPAHGSIAGWQGVTPIVAVRMIPIDAVPTRKPQMTPAGKPSFRKRTKTELNRFYLETLSSLVLAAVRACFASAPRLSKLCVLLVGRDSRMDSEIAAYYMGTFERRQLQTVGRQQTPNGATRALLEAESPSINIHGRTEEIGAVTLPDDSATLEAMERTAAAMSLSFSRTSPATTSRPSTGPQNRSQSHSAPRFTGRKGIRPHRTCRTTPLPAE